ncbi:MAG: hypothetical protein R3C18_10175 [Planctomycetaceae bacterium]
MQVAAADALEQRVLLSGTVPASTTVDINTAMGEFTTTIELPTGATNGDMLNIVDQATNGSAYIQYGYHGTPGVSDAILYVSSGSGSDSFSYLLSDDTGTQQLHTVYINDVNTPSSSSSATTGSGDAASYGSGSGTSGGTGSGTGPEVVADPPAPDPGGGGTGSGTGPEVVVDPPAPDPDPDPGGSGTGTGTGDPPAPDPNNTAPYFMEYGSRMAAGDRYEFHFSYADGSYVDSVYGFDDEYDAIKFSYSDPSGYFVVDEWAGYVHVLDPTIPDGEYPFEVTVYEQADPGSSSTIDVIVYVNQIVVDQEWYFDEVVQQPPVNEPLVSVGTVAVTGTVTDFSVNSIQGIRNLPNGTQEIISVPYTFPLNVAISDPDANGPGGELFIAWDLLDYEDYDGLLVSVTASDGNQSDSGNVTVWLNDVNETPSIWRNGVLNQGEAVTSTEGQSFYLVADGLSSGILEYLASDPDNADVWRQAPYDDLSFSDTAMPSGILGPEVTTHDSSNVPNSPLTNPIWQAQYHGRLSLASAGEHDVTITVSDSGGLTATYTFHWTVYNYQLTIAEMTLGSTLGANDRHAVLPDPVLDASDNIEQPFSLDYQWLDWDFDYVSDWSFDSPRNAGEGVLSPVLLTRGTTDTPMKITADATFVNVTNYDNLPAPLCWDGTETIYVRSNATAAPLTIMSTGGQVTFSGAVSDEKTAIEYDPSFRLEWEFSLDGQTWETAGVTETPVYIGHKTPEAEATFYRTVVHIGVTNGAKATVEWAGDAAIFTEIWGEFSDKIVQKYDPQGTGATLYYYNKSKYVHNQWPIAPDQSVGNATRNLLGNEDGRCGDWARFLVSIAATQGIVTNIVSVKGKVNPSGIPADATHIGIKVKATALGQGNAVPGASQFWDHALVSFGGQEYDPSYGRAEVNRMAWEWESLEKILYMKEVTDAMGDKTYPVVGFWDEEQFVLQTN